MLIGRLPAVMPTLRDDLHSVSTSVSQLHGSSGWTLWTQVSSQQEHEVGERIVGSEMCIAFFCNRSGAGGTASRRLRPAPDAVGEGPRSLAEAAGFEPARGDYPQPA